MQGEWLRTGDMYFLDTDGYFYLGAPTTCSVGGMWVSPTEVEGRWRTIPRSGGGSDRPARQRWSPRAHAFWCCGRGPSRRALEAELRDGAEAALRVQGPPLDRLRCRLPRPTPARSSGSSCGRLGCASSSSASPRPPDRRGRDGWRWPGGPRVARGVPGPAGTIRLRQVHPAQHHRRPAARQLGPRLLRGRAAEGRPLTAMVFQEFALFPWRTVRANVEFGLEELGVPGRAGGARAALRRAHRPRRIRGRTLTSSRAACASAWASPARSPSIPRCS